jgi:hypothetical protein
MQPAMSMPRPRKRFLAQNGGNADIEVARAWQLRLRYARPEIHRLAEP